MFTSKRPEVSLKAKYGLVIRFALMLSLVVLIGVFLAIPRVESREQQVQQPVVPIKSLEIPPVIDRTLPPPPKKPDLSEPIPKEDLPGDVTIEPTFGVEFRKMPPPPEPLANNTAFIPKEDMPKIIGGYAALLRNVKYPELAQRAEIEGTVKVRAFIDKYGQVTDTEVMEGIPNSGLNEAAEEAVKKTKFIPAVQRDKNVGVWMEFSIVFKLKN